MFDTEGPCDTLYSFTDSETGAFTRWHHVAHKKATFQVSLKIMIFTENYHQILNIVKICGYHYIVRNIANINFIK